MTDGMKTSEFYISVAVAFFGVLVALGVIGPDQADIAADWVGGVVQAVGGLVAAIAVGGYSISRGISKSGN